MLRDMPIYPEKWIWRSGGQSLRHADHELAAGLLTMLAAQTLGLVPRLPHRC